MSPKKNDQQLNGDISGSYADPDRIRDILDRAQENYILVGPTVVKGTLPEGFALSLAVHRLDIKKDTYDVAGGRALSRTAIADLAAMAGVSTLESTCVAQDVNYCQYLVTVEMKDLDGTVRTEKKSKAMDLRDGSGQIAAMREAARLKKDERGQPKNADAQIREQRLHIAAHAETKAWLRAVRALLALRTYTVEELQNKPFLVTKLQFTGQSDDPELRRMFALGRMAAALGARELLFKGGSAVMLGQMAPPPPMLTQGAQAPQLGTGRPAGAPPIGLNLPDDDDDQGAQPRGPIVTPPPAEKPLPEAPKMMWGPAMGKQINDPTVPLEVLEKYRAQVVKSVDDPSKQKFRARNVTSAQALADEIERRKNPEKAAAEAAAKEDEQAGVYNDEEGS
jgi:hypothetical protein